MAPPLQRPRVALARRRGRSAAFRLRPAWTAAACAACAASIAVAEKPGYDQYFEIYGHHDIHRQMIQDRPRTQAYAEALAKEPSVVRGKTVLDFGCGTGILSVFAARAGAERVVCLEASPMAEVAEKVVAKNGFAGKIHVVRTTHDELQLPEKVDMIISEWMGFWMLTEDMLVDLLYLRDRWLKPGGVVWPRFTRLFMQPYSSAEWWRDNVDYWTTSPYGVDMSPMTDYAFGDGDQWPVPLRGQWPPSGLAGSPHLISEWDLQSVRLTDSTKVVSQFRIPVPDRTVHGMLYWFDVVFDHPEGDVTLSTHPSAGVQHWNQIFWPLRGAPLADPDLVLSGSVRVEHEPPQWNFTISWKARPLRKKATTTSSGPVGAESFVAMDQWVETKALEALMALDTGRADGGSPAASHAAMAEL